ncbi:hypothetical protein ACKKBF_B11680 [Auxenochlorella protothecoides x Auxenochlorella symbiontica]
MQEMFSSTLQPSTTSGSLSEKILQHRGKDIIKKGFARRKRFLVAFCMKLQALTGGKLGTLSNLDSAQPTMHIDLPQGALQLTGTLTFPRTKYAVLRLGSKDVLCEDLFDSLIVFDKYTWLSGEGEGVVPAHLPAQPMEATMQRDEGGAASPNTPKRSSGPPVSDAGTAMNSQVVSQETPPSSQRRSGRLQTAKRQRIVTDWDTSSEDSSSPSDGSAPESSYSE